MMKVAYTGWTWINNREPEAAKRLLEASFRECKFLGYDYVENFAFIRDYYAENPQELVDLTKACGVNLVNLYGHFTFDVESALDIAKGVKWYNCQNAGFGDDGPTERPTNPEMIDKMCYIANTLGEYAKSLGVTVCFHPHYGTCVFSQSDIDYFAAHTNPEYVSFCFDTAHTTLAGMDPVALIRQYGEEMRANVEENIDDLLFRFGNKALKDTVARVGGDLVRKLRRNVETIEAELADIERQIAAYDAKFAAATDYNEADYKAYNDLKTRYDHQMHEWEKASYELEITENA